MEEKARFGDLKDGNFVYRIVGLDVKELKISKVNLESYSSVTLVLESGERLYVGKYFSSSCNSTVFVKKEDAWKRLISDSRARYKELEEQIDNMITEFDKLEKFLDGIKGKILW